MALPSFLKRKDSPAAKPVPTAEGADVLQARVHARRRLIGAAVLLGVGVLTFPLLFETQPRPIPVDVPIETTRKDAAAPLPASSRPARPLLPAAADPNANVVAEAPLPPASVSAPVLSGPPAAASARVQMPAPASAPPAVAVAPAKPSPRDGAGPVAPAAKPAASSVASAAASTAAGAAATEAKSGRFVVQVGAFADAGAARDVRVKVERLGLKTYTQIVDTEGGKRTRVRIGPFDSRDDAGKVLAKLKSANLPGAVLTL
jgi:DedD protein